jgi:hypothetical protein
MSTEVNSSSGGGRWRLLFHSFQELESLGLHIKKINDLNDAQELGDLIENIKQTYFQDYKTCYDQQQIEEKNFMIPFK